MPGSSKKKVSKLRDEGKHELADWFEAKEKARAEGKELWRWMKENPKPGEVSTPKESTNQRTLRKINEFRDSDEVKKNFTIPPQELGILEKIRENKKKLKVRARKAFANNSVTELRTLYKVMNRLDVEEKKIIFKYDFAQFDDYFFSDIQDRVATAPFHYEMVKLYNTAPRSCVVCPRGHAKSTTARKYILHQLLYREVTYVVIIGASEEMAAQNLRWIRDQFTDNDRVIDVYGYLKNKDKWADSQFQTNTGLKVVAKGAGQKVRGANEKGRPDMIYIDDLEDDEQVSSRDRRTKLKDWLTKALMPSKSRNGRIIITGTILHMDSLLKNISENKVKDHLPWQVLWYQALSKNEDGEEVALWPEHKPVSELVELRNTDPESFAQEYQNNPTSGAMQVFKRDEYNYYDENDIRIDDVEGKVYVKGKQVSVLLTPDLALSEREGADYTVFTITGMDSGSNLYVLDYERFRSADPYEQIEMMFDMMRKWHCEIMTMETVAFQKTFKRMLEYEMEKRDIFFYIHELSRSSIRKIFRIKALKAPIRASKIYWRHDHFELEDELSQVSATSLGTHDDVIDTLADSWEVQVEMYEENNVKAPEINTVEWAIQEGLLPTEYEKMEMSRYG